MPEHYPPEASSSAPRIDLQEMLSLGSPLNLVEVFRRQFWLVAACTSLGMAFATIYWLNAEEWYESRARVLVSQKDPRLATSSAPGMAATQERVVNEDILANHMEVIRSPRIVDIALKRNNLTELPSIQDQIKGEDIDAGEYVISQLELTRGGEGRAKDARSLTIVFQHPNPEDAQTVLKAIVGEYQAFLGAQLESAMKSANLLIRRAQSDMEAEMAAAQQEYIDARRAAPVLFTGEGSSNVYLEQFRRVHEEMLEQEIMYSSMQTRLQRVKNALAEHREREESTPEDDMQMLSLIDSDSLERLGIFASLQVNSARSADFQASQPARNEKAQAEFSHLLSLMSEEQRLRSEFGDGHPEVAKVRQEIELVKNFVADQSDKTDIAWEDAEITPAMLLNAYVGFLENDLAAIEERRTELKTLAVDAESQAKALVEFELKDKVLQTAIQRKQLLYDSIVEQIRDLDTASGMSGYIHELLEAPEYGERVWPDLKLCGSAGIFLGLMIGLALALINDQIESHFRSPEEIDRLIDLPIVGRIGRINSGRRDGVAALVASELTAESEAFRFLRTMLLPRVKAGRLNRIAVTSPVPGDGKSTMIANLAAAFAKVNLDVLLIDADMRRPTIHRLMDTDNEHGLSEVLREEIPLDEALMLTDIENLSVLTSGRCPDNPAELLESDDFDALMERLNDRFDVVLIDVGPVLVVSDPCVVAKKVDGMIIVVRPSNDTKNQACDAVRRLRSVGTHLLGCVINTFGSGKEFEQAGGYYGEYSESYTITNSKVTSNGHAKPKSTARKSRRSEREDLTKS